MRIAVWGAVLALVIPACGGGSSEASLQASALEGVVYEVDGQANGLGGIVVAVRETGEVAVTDGAGDFVFPALEPGTYTLDFDGVGDQIEGDRVDEAHPRVDVDGDGERIGVRVALDGGRVREFEVEHRDVREASARLHVVSDDHDGVLEGRIRVRARGDRQDFSVVVEGLDAGQAIGVFLGVPGATAQLVGDPRANEDGRAEFRRDTGENQDLPLGVDSLDALAGRRVEITLAGSDEVVMVGEVPDLPAREEDEEGDEEGEDEREDDERDGEEDDREGKEEDGEENEDDGDDEDEPREDDEEDGDEEEPREDDEDPAGDDGEGGNEDEPREDEDDEPREDEEEEDDHEEPSEDEGDDEEPTEDDSDEAR